MIINTRREHGNETKTLEYNSIKDLFLNIEKHKYSNWVKNGSIKLNWYLTNDNTIIKHYSQNMIRSPGLFEPINIKFTWYEILLFNVKNIFKKLRFQNNK